MCMSNSPLDYVSAGVSTCVFIYTSTITIKSKLRTRIRIKYVWRHGGGNNTEWWEM